MSPKYQSTCCGDILYSFSIPIQKRALVKAEFAVQGFGKESGAELERVRVRIVCIVVIRTVRLGLGGCSEAVVLEIGWIDAPTVLCGGLCLVLACEAGSQSAANACKDHSYGNYH